MGSAQTPVGLLSVPGTETWVQSAVPRAGHLVEEQTKRTGEVRDKEELQWHMFLI